MRAIVAGNESDCLRLFPMSRVELLGIKRARIKLRIAQDVGILLAEDHLVINVNFDARRHPAARHLAVIFKADVLELARDQPA